MSKGADVKHLYLLRHAKSAYPAGVSDIDRPLNGRGRMTADRMGRHMAATGAVPDLILCSAAARTRETLHRITPFLGEKPVVLVEAELYLAGERTLLAHLRRAEDRHRRVLLIGHNPGLQSLALLLAEGDDPEREARMAAKFPTAGLAAFDCDIESWAALSAQTSRLADFVSPRSLAA